jgi:hypothetical protein
VLEDSAGLLPNFRMRDFGPRPTLGDLQRTTPWVWLWCERCQHHAPLACAVAVIRWGPDTSSDKLRAGARCTSCGSKGATVQHPGWAGNHIGFSPFPTNVDDEVDAQPPLIRRGDRARSDNGFEGIYDPDSYLV